MTDPFQAIQDKMEKLENQVKRLQESNQKLSAKNHYCKKNHRPHSQETEKLQAELEQAHLINSKLQVEVNNIKRDKRSAEKLKKIKALLE